MKINICIFLVALFPCFTNAGSKVQLIYEGEEKRLVIFDAGADLAQLLHHPLLPNDIYWRNAKISTPELVNIALEEKDRLLKDLKNLQINWMRKQEGGLVQSSQQLLRELDKLSVSGHVPIMLDPDLSRISLVNNPVLSGDYILFMAPRSFSINIIGLINGASVQPLIAGAGLEDYWSGYSLLPGADPAEVYLIQPTGEISQVPVAQWNLLHREPMAGATIFVGFSKNILPPEYHNINLRIASLISERIPK